MEPHVALRPRSSHSQRKDPLGTNARGGYAWGSICSLLDQGPHVWPLQGSRREDTGVRKAVGWWFPISHWGDLFEGEAGLEPMVGKSER